MNRLRPVSWVGPAALAILALSPTAGLAGEAASATAPGVQIRVQPDVPDGYPDRVGRFVKPLRQDLTSLELTSRGGGRYGLRLSAGGGPPALPDLLADLDLRPFVARVPALARGNPALTRLALIQRELNRVQTRYAAAGKPESVWVANNCLKRGLWEIGLDRAEPGQGNVTTYHGWFTFPEGEYARLFEAANGVPFAAVAAGFEGYPPLDGLAVPLADLRSVESEARLPAIDTHAGDPIDAFGEQSRKSKLVLAPAAKTYGDWWAPDHQPVTSAKFSEPGFYNRSEPVRFDLAWLGHPVEARWRRVASAKVAGAFPEIEVRFANGRRLLLADARLPELQARGAKPADEADLLQLTFGIGTPTIYATAEERARDLAAERPAYLLLLDGEDRNVDNHLAGIDRVYLWREAGDPGRLHLYLVSYERIALIGHWTLPWQG